MNARYRLLGAALTCAFAAVPLVALPEQTDAVRVFNEQCSACHSIGGGDLAGPDLQGLDARPADEVRAAVVRMEEHVGTIPQPQVEALVALLRDANAKVRLAGGSEPVAAAPAGSAENGRRLFHGEARLQNGAVACFGCHAAEGRGGNLARDVTQAHARMGDAGLVAVSERPGFAAMKAAYGARPVTHEEALDLAAYLRETATKQEAQDAKTEPTGAIHGTATGLAVAVFAAVVVVFRPRRRTLRAWKSRR